ncbi:Uncharacterized protein SCF082_LOCUS14368 [Durusdinium trenchii]|uniref:Uncharacterized protein n=1 Tax=Durusdinium trenchii TaxID=1381693 RepID=A0ABP0JX74_9DINO
MPAATGNPLPSLAELQMHGRHIKEAIDEQPTPIRLASYLGPGGTLALLITALVASSTAACLDHCLRVSDVLEDRCSTLDGRLVQDVVTDVPMTPVVWAPSGRSGDAEALEEADMTGRDTCFCLADVKESQAAATLAMFLGSPAYAQVKVPRPEGLPDFLQTPEKEPRLTFSR